MGKRYVTNAQIWSPEEKAETRRKSGCLLPAKKPFSAEELEALQVNCSNLRDRALVEFLYSTGVRGIGPGLKIPIHIGFGERL